jgi:hypothetical protein
LVIRSEWKYCDKELGYGRRIIMLYFCHILQCELFFETGANEKTRIIDVRCVQQQIGEKEGKALIGFHIYTGKK